VVYAEASYAVAELLLFFREGEFHRFQLILYSDSSFIR
jgi:hypothetical protein